MTVQCGNLISTLKVEAYKSLVYKLSAITETAAFHNVQEKTVCMVTEMLPIDSLTEGYMSQVYMASSQGFMRSAQKQTFRRGNIALNSDIYKQADWTFQEHIYAEGCHKMVGTTGMVSHLHGV